uniref:N/A n=1 Tax=Ganoderma boninense TaxID=34458 RepID=A0A5K1JSU5_9APHY|nr:N/A [Ganoderma boninense]
MPDADAASSQHLDSSQTQFNPDRDGELYEVVEILAERGKKYLVKWAGIDESTGKPWKDTWVFKTDTTDDLTREWKLKKHATNKRTKSDGRFLNLLKDSETRCASATPSSTRLPLNASSSRASPAAQPDNSPTTRKRRRDLRASHPMVVEVPTPEPSRPRKKRKLEVEVVQPPSRHPSEEPQSDDEVVGRKRSGKTAVRRMQDADEDSNASPRPGGSLDRVRPPSAAGRRRTAKAADHEDEVEDEEEHAEYAVPTTKVGPPRHLKRRRQTVPTPQTSPEMVPISPIPVRQPRRAKRIARPPGKQLSASPDHASNPKLSAPSTLSNGAKGKGLLKSNSLPRGLTGSKRPSLESSSDSDDAEEEEASRLFKALNVPSSRPSYLTLKARQSLMQEEEENTQEAAGIVPSSPPNPSLSPLLPEPEPEPEPEQESESEGPGPTLGPGPYRLGQRHGRPFANDTFSRLGIVPETQATKAQEALDEAPYDPSQHDLVSDFDVLRTPVRRSKGSSSRPGSVSLISKMKNKRKGKSKELLPIPQLSPSAFRPYLPQEDEIENFSSPEKDKRRPRREAEPFTQDTIEDFSQDADMDHFMDWEGGQQPAELLASVHENGPDLSLGPELTPPDAEGGPRKVMEQLLSKVRLFDTRQNHKAILNHVLSSVQEDARRDVPVSPEIPPLPEFPLTSTTQQAEVDSMSQQPSIRSSQIAELNAVLEEKDEKLTQLESQVEELQTRIAELESENAEGRATLEIELETLRAESGEKAEQITQLENQLVELQLQLTQLTADNENIRNLNESLEERNEQVSQLEGALVELQVEVEAIEAEKEKLEMAKHQHSTEREHDAHDQEQLTALQQRLSALEDELARAQQQHEETIASLTQRLEITSQEHEGRVKGIEDDRDLFRKLYDDASTHAQRLARENAELEEGRQRAEGRAQAGVAMVKATFTAQVAALKAEVERLTALVKVLNDKDARTDDDVRARAAREPELQEENAVLRRDNMELRRKVEQMLIIGTAAKWADDDREDEDYVPDGEDGGSPSSSPSSNSSDSDNDSDGRASPVSVRAPASHSSSPDRGYFFVCQHVSGEHMCNKTFADAQGVIEHANNIHYHDVQRPDF